MDDAYRFGIEEEYFLAEAATGRSPSGPALDAFHTAAEAELDPAEHELLKGQVEVATKPATDPDATCATLRSLRRDLAKIAAGHGLALFAAGTHPLGEVRLQYMTQKERYEKLKAEFGIIASHSIVCAMHIHVEVPDPGERVQTMNRLVPFLPLFYALSTASAFWQGRPCGLHGFRLSAFREWPRMGLPEIFARQSDYDRMVAVMTESGMIENASFIWWLIRPSTKYPTIEMRICDSCTRVEDAVAIAMLFRCCVRAVSRRRDINADYGPLARAIAGENMWQAQRKGVQASFIAGERGGAEPVAASLERVIALVEEDARALGCARWLDQARAIVRKGTSADRQIAVFEDALAQGNGEEDAMLAVTRMLAKTTAA